MIPVASGSQLTKIDKGLKELIALGLVEDRPYRIFGAQAAGCAPVSRAYKDGHDVVRPVKPTRSPSPSPSATRPTGRTSWTSRGGRAVRWRT
ncbi:hypothetical protein GCM10020221_05440 [Streptomyces thioluteus]|uniref:Uncharacterized protein n=1 Tax=Streptomyces thioluteus TaxID=66431 RepID=A0ABN3WF82_STRTU